ncbi:MAG TPA: TlyA family rRNA (cytidine-2'-O)-methyltransferase, partial [Acidimicrobiia bacterium]
MLAPPAHAVEVGVGQLLGRLRADARVVNLEGHNLAVVDGSVIPDAAGVVTIDVSYLPAADALDQLAGLAFAARADLVVLVKPTFELGAAALVRDDERVEQAVERVVRAMARQGWELRGRCAAPVTGRG